MMRDTRVFKILGAYRNLPSVDFQAIETVLLRLSEIACELPWIEKLEINPLIADEDGAIAGDARVVIRDVPPSQKHYAHMSIRPYPVDLIRVWRQVDGSVITIRPIRPEDAEIERDFVKGLSDESRHSRFMNSLRELTPAMLARFTQIDYDREMALVAISDRDGHEVEIGVARFVTNPDSESCEFAVVVGDAWQGTGLGRRLMNSLIGIARKSGLKSMVGYVLADNRRMLALCAKLGFEIAKDSGDPMIRRAILDLVATEPQH
jgi:acetyltransferase